MDAITALKNKGNTAFTNSRYEQACALYGECMEAMISAEKTTPALSQSAEFRKLKPVIFLNLAIANLKLGAYEGCRRCCNAAIVFCNKPTLDLSDLGIDDDLTEDVILCEPIASDSAPLAAKALYRRGLSYQEQFLFEKAVNDISGAFRILPSDTAIGKSLDDLIQKIASNSSSPKITQPQVDQHRHERISPNILPRSALSPQYLAMTNNGGICCRYFGCYWSQRVQDATVYISVDRYKEKISTRRVSSNLCLNAVGSEHVAARRGWLVEFGNREIFIQKVEIGSNDDGTRWFLEHAIKPAECLWTIDSVCDPEQGRDATFVVLHLVKMPAIEWFPGCEWWDKVCMDDEPIDTLCCSVGADCSELPDQARIRAEREHARFTDLSDIRKHEELEAIGKAKKHYQALTAETLDVFNRRNFDQGVTGPYDTSGAMVGNNECSLEPIEPVEGLNDDTMVWLREQFPTIDFSIRDERDSSK